MGKPYESEIANLPKTVSWALAFDVEPLASLIREASGRHLTATGSGGSLSAATLAAQFHQVLGIGFSASITPLETTSLRGSFAGSIFLLVSAGGANSDILTAFKYVAEREPYRLIALTGRLGTPLGELVKEYPVSDCIELDLPSKKDGFLATNSLAAFSVVLARAYSAAMHKDGAKFSSLRRVVESEANWSSHLAELDRVTANLWERDNLVVLHPPAAKAGAVDIESKFTESALGTVHTADYRHFAHGRHHWLAKRGDTTAVLAFVTPEYRGLAEKTLACLPSGIPVSQVHLDQHPLEAGVAAVITSIILAGLAGKQRGIDPGRPGVPAFGRKIYHLRWKSPWLNRSPAEEIVSAGCRRKWRAAGFQIDPSPNEIRLWKMDCERFVTLLHELRLKAVVFDYDGTMVCSNRRFDPLPTEIAAYLIRLLGCGVVLGVASGRGKSLRQALQAALPGSLWDRVVLGYYSGGQTGLLADDSLPRTLPMEPELVEIQRQITSSRRLAKRVDLDPRNGQLSIVPKLGLRVDDLWNLVAELLGGAASSQFRVVRSCHSVDILAVNISKSAVAKQVCRLISAQTEEILRIGDQGRWPGNDHELLAKFPSLSVDEVSSNRCTCWNLAAPGQTGPNALRSYFGVMRIGKGAFRIDFSRLLKGMR
jgi:fructoselysine-6-P-deglycase FrlB-like protein